METINNGTFAYGYTFSKLSIQVEQIMTSILICRSEYAYVVVTISLIYDSDICSSNSSKQRTRSAKVKTR